ncbi:MAG: copper homeostasis protein CutC [Anaerorhabdus sp.]|uniref:copper homeostasis protein CutC n=1 Tax=Anaerorhabdus sp. TaxID=1872524 RepID=UPI002B208222|nr:copper homeostasis protein CutC [Anaerorhabdus sp.]MEA4875230.1 copper homeostasis protein CutC [Anaerorhabdus sp.]
MINNRVIEICCGSIEDVITASKEPIDRIELNSALELGGMTCSLGTLIESKKVTTLPLCCMVRPRTSGFHYTERQFESMLFDAEQLCIHDADGIVFGFLNADNSINIERTKKMADLVHRYNKEVIFHKAFDATTDKFKACEDCIACGVDRILTSGGENYPHIEEGFETLHKLIETYQDRITILVGGGVRDFNVQTILTETNCHEIHMTAKQTAYDDGDYTEVSPTYLRTILSKIEEMNNDTN